MPGACDVSPVHIGAVIVPAAYFLVDIRCARSYPQAHN
jgi:hypothetical protein